MALFTKPVSFALRRSDRRPCMICSESLLSSPKVSYGSGEMTSEEIKDQVYAMGKKARSAALALAVLSEEKKNEILRAMAGGIRAAASEILEANAKDIAAGEERGLIRRDVGPASSR